MPIQSTRKLIPWGGTYAVTIPAGWVRFYGLKAGDRLEMVANGEIIIKRIEKEPEGQTVKTEA